MFQPITIKIKVMGQQICKLNLRLGQCFSLQVEAKLKKLRYHKVDKNELQLKIELHGFSDASLKTCGAVICWRCLSKSSNITTNLIASKSRIAPIKPTTLA